MIKRLLFVLVFWPVELLTNGPKYFWKNIVSYVKDGK